jgi:hypothetical protein
MLNTLAQIAMKPIPRSVSPKAHSIVDFITVGTFLAGAALFWRHNKRAAVASLVCGAADLAVTLLTDYPGGVDRVISYRAHRDIDLGLAAMFATMPDFLAFSDEREKKFFLLQGALTTALAETTQFPEAEQPKEKSATRAA